MKIKFHEDSGHGWYAVKRKVLEQLGLLNKITSYSYQRGKTVYLEEDCDAGVLFNKLNEINIAPRMTYAKHQDRSPIRSYESYS